MDEIYYSKKGENMTNRDLISIIYDGQPDSVKEKCLKILKQQKEDEKLDLDLERAEDVRLDLIQEEREKWEEYGCKPSDCY